MVTQSVIKSQKVLEITRFPAASAAHPW